MTLSGVRGFFKTQMVALKFKEWTDPFNMANIPATILDRSYHLDLGKMTIQGMGAQGRGFEFHNTITMKMVRKGFKDASKAVDEGLDQAQTIMGAIVAGARLLDQQGLKIVLPTGLDVQPFSQDNEHSAIIVMTFRAVFVLGF